MTDVWMETYRKRCALWAETDWVPGDLVAVDVGKMLDHMERLEAENERMREGLERIRVASEFYAQFADTTGKVVDGVSADVIRYAHESTKRLCDNLLADKEDE